MKPYSPTWKHYDMYEWDAICGVSPDLRRHSGKFSWNKYGVCTNPHVFGVGSCKKNWRVGIFTAQRPDGTWSSGKDILFTVCGRSGLPSNLHGDTWKDEDAAIIAELESASSMIREFLKYHGKESSTPCEGALRQALGICEGELARRSSPKLPTYTQLSLF